MYEEDKSIIMVVWNLERMPQPIFRVIARSPPMADDEAISRLDVKNNGEIASLRSQ